MAPRAKTQTKAQAAAPEEAKAPKVTETPEAPKPDEGENREGNKNMDIVQAMEVASRSGKVRREGWPKELSKRYVIVKRDETLPTLTDGKYYAPYMPSIVDVMVNDWYEIID